MMRRSIDMKAERTEEREYKASAHIVWEAGHTGAARRGKVFDRRGRNVGECQVIYGEGGSVSAIFMGNVAFVDRRRLDACDV